MSEEIDQIYEIRKYLMNNHSVLSATFDMLSYNRANIKTDDTVISPEFLDGVYIMECILDDIEMNIEQIDEFLGWVDEGHESENDKME